MKIFAPTFLAAALMACASAGSERVETALRELDADAGQGVAKISRALSDPSLSSPALGEGTRIVQSAAADLAQLEVDERASDFQQLMAILYQARAWDDVATAYATAPVPTTLSPEQRALFERLLGEKAIPARLSAADAFQRARARACRMEFETSPVMTEILTGLERYSETPGVLLDSPCNAE